jgi:hypothetical protein
MLLDVLDPSPAAALQQLQHLLHLLECWLPFGCTSTLPRAKNCKPISSSRSPRRRAIEAACGVVVRHDAPALVAPVWVVPRPDLVHRPARPAASPPEVGSDPTRRLHHAHRVCPIRLIRRINCGDRAGPLTLICQISAVEP